MSGDPDCLASITINNSNNPCLCMTNVASLQWHRPRNDFEAVGEMYKFKPVAVNTRGKDSLHGCLPTSVIAKSIGALTSSVRAVLNFSCWLPTTVHNASAYLQKY